MKPLFAFLAILCSYTSFSQSFLKPNNINPSYPNVRAEKGLFLPKWNGNPVIDSDSSYRIGFDTTSNKLKAYSKATGYITFGDFSYTLTNDYFDDGDTVKALTASNAAGRIFNILYNLIDSYTGEEVTYTKVTTWHDGTAMTNGKVDGVIYREKNSEYFKRNYDKVNVKWFGAVGDGITDNTAAINKAIDYANSVNPSIVDAAGVTGATLYFADGKYRINSSLHPIKRSGVNIEGEGDNGTILLPANNTIMFDFGGTDGYVVGGGVSHLKIEYSGASTNSIAIQVQNAHRLEFHNILLVNVGTFLNLGTSNSRVASNINVYNVVGYCYNGGQSFIRPNYGAGLYMSMVEAFVGSILPPVVNRTSTMTTEPGTTAVSFVQGWWDTFNMAQCQFQNFDYGVSAIANNVVVQSFTITHTYFDYMKTSAILLNGINGGAVTSINLTDNWYASWEDNAITLAGTVISVNILGGRIESAGRNGISIGANVKEALVSNMTINGVNRLEGTSFGIIVEGTGHKIINNNIGQKIVGGSFPWQNFAGVGLAPSVDDIIVTGNKWYGSYGGLYAEPSTKHNRIIRSNIPDTYEPAEAIGLNAGTPSAAFLAKINTLDAVKVMEIGTIPRQYPHPTIADSFYYGSGGYRAYYLANKGLDTVERVDPQTGVFSYAYGVKTIAATDSNGVVIKKQLDELDTLVVTPGGIAISKRGDYVFTGSTPASWTVPTLSGNNRAVYYIKNRGSANITLGVTGGGSTLYITAPSATLTIAPGEAYRISNDGTYYNVE